MTFESGSRETVMTALIPKIGSGPRAARKERRKIWNIIDVSHCSIIGTCMSVVELRRLARRVGVTQEDRYTDYEIHGWFVDQMGHENPLSRAAQEYLDGKFEGAIRKAAPLSGEDAFAAHWEEALDNGFVAGAYWAIVTHPGLPPSIESRIFGHIHMMSHISGTSHRLEARVVAEARREKAEIARRLSRLLSQRNEELNLARSEVTKLTAEARESRRLADEIVSLRRALESDEGQIRIEAQAREIETLRAENEALTGRLRRLATERDRLDARLERLQRFHYAEKSVDDEDLEQSESVYAARIHDDEQPSNLCGRCLLYVGGRPRTVCRLRQWVAERDGSLIHHDGGLEDSRAILGDLVRRADAVFFPIDCVSHNAADVVKSLCDSHGVPYAPLPSASATAFTRAVRAIAGVTQQTAVTSNQRQF